MGNYLSPEQITEYTSEAGVRKGHNNFTKSFLLAFMGGMFIALAAIGSIIATCTIENYSIAALVAGIVFSTGLMLVVIAGGDLFTGNVLIIISVLQKKTSIVNMLVNLVTVFFGNLTGALFIALLVHYSGLLANANGVLAAKLMAKAAHKLEYPLHQAFFLGILCNLLVCLAVWMMYSAKDTGGKVLACLFPITLFILSGYEHIVANMYYIPAGILAASSSELVRISGISGHIVSVLDLHNVLHNFIPVTLGNLVGGLVIGVGYFAIYGSRSVQKSGNDIKISV